MISKRSKLKSIPTTVWSGFLSLARLSCDTLVHTSMQAMVWLLGRKLIYAHIPPIKRAWAHFGSAMRAEPSTCDIITTYTILHGGGGVGAFSSRYLICGWTSDAGPDRALRCQSMYRTVCASPFRRNWVVRWWTTTSVGYYWRWRCTILCRIGPYRIVHVQ